MATVLVRRRFPRLSRVTAALLTSSAPCKAEGGGGRRKEEEEEEEENPKKGAAIQLLTPPGYRVLHNPAAYARSKAGSSLQALGDAPSGSAVPAASSQLLPPARNALAKPPRRKKTPLRAKQEVEKEQSELHDSKEDPRVFQRGRPEYKSLCYDRFEPLEALPGEEAEAILLGVTSRGGNQSPAAIAECFHKLSRLPEEHHAALLAEPGFDALSRCAVEQIQSFPTPQLVEILKACVRLGVPPTHPLLDACECDFCRRAWAMSLEQLLLVADCWRCLQRAVPSYLSILFSYAARSCKDLALPQLVQLLYIIGEGRRAPPELVQKLEGLIWKHLDACTLEEVGAISLGLFKSLSTVPERLVRRIADRVAPELEEMSTYALVNVLKLLRYARLDHLPLLRELGRVIPPRIPTTNVQGLMHVALTCSSLHYYDEAVLAAVAAALPSKVAYCRSKDAAKFLWSFGCLDYEPPNEEEFYSSLIEHARRKLREFDRFPEHLLTGLLGLAFVGRFPEELIDYALSEDFVQKTRNSKYELGKDLFTLGRSVEIECPGYRGSRLGPQLYQEMTQLVLAFAQQEIFVRPEIVEAVSLLESVLGGPEYVKSHMILPHTRSGDLEVQLAADGRPVPFNVQDSAGRELRDIGVSLTDDLMAQLLKGKWSSQPRWGAENEAAAPPWEPRGENQAPQTPFSGRSDTASSSFHVLPPPGGCLDAPSSPAPPQQPGGVKLAIQVSNRNHYCYLSKRLLGLHRLKRRQLRLLGYVVLELPFWEWFPLLKRTRSEKLSYLHYKVFDPALLRGAP
uniref:FAST kinase domains 5 n=1 Tax=Cairina moschata TaxID=8855 RepID=A0A8C3CL43_CAIMO